jgi:hypothetical protein
MGFGEFIFYNIESLNLDQKHSMLIDCKKISCKWFANILDCRVSCSRQQLECSFEEILNRMREDTHLVVINRGAWGDPFLENREYFEIGFRTMETPIDYFLFIYVKSEGMPGILEKYKLEPMNYGEGI